MINTSNGLLKISDELTVFPGYSCEQEYSEKNEKERKLLHDEILHKLGIDSNSRYVWGKILSEYDARSNLSSINIIYKENV